MHVCHNVCMYACVHFALMLVARPELRTHVCVCVFMHVCVYVCSSAAWPQTQMHLRYVFVCVCACACMHVHMVSQPYHAISLLMLHLSIILQLSTVFNGCSYQRFSIGQPGKKPLKAVEPLPVILQLEVPLLIK
jgi:hypothetical protein